MSVSVYLLTVAVLLLVSILTSKFSAKIGFPALLIFLGVGIFFGSDGINLIYFDNYELAQSIGIIALVYILFSGGLDTRWKKVLPILRQGIALSSIGVLISAGIVGVFAYFLLDFSVLESLLLGSIISSTDAAAVFSVLRSKSLGFKYRLKEIMEFESGTNDPMAIFLTVGLIELILMPELPISSLLILFLKQLVIGFIVGYALGKAIIWLINNINLDYDGLYPVLTLALVPLVYSITDLLGGSGFLAVYIAGLILGNSNFIHQKSLMNFFDGISWLMQITMFLTLGLLVFPKEILAISLEGILISLVLIILARPISVFVSLIFSKLKVRAKLMISWTGLRGAVPIIMATFPLVAGVPNSELLFSIVFFVVVTSVLIQAPTIPLVAKWLHVDSPVKAKTKFPIEFEPSVDTKSALKEIELEENDPSIGKQIVELNLPEDVLIVIINRKGGFIVSRGTTRLEVEDKLLVLAKKEMISMIRDLLKNKTVFLK